MTLKLVKDFRNYQFVYFWISKNKKAVSPFVPTLEHANEWFTDQHFSAHDGKERRKRTVDRRNNAPEPSHNNSDTAFSRRIPSSPGRRASDLKISVDYDLSVGKISKLKEAQ